MGAERLALRRPYLIYGELQKTRAWRLSQGLTRKRFPSLPEHEPFGVLYCTEAYVKHFRRFSPDADRLGELPLTIRLGHDEAVFVGHRSAVQYVQQVLKIGAMVSNRVGAKFVNQFSIFGVRQVFACRLVGGCRNGWSSVGMSQSRVLFVRLVLRVSGTVAP